VLTVPLLESCMRYGPVAVFGRYNQEGNQLNHAMVISGLRGDESHPDSVELEVNDPWARGTSWTGPFATFNRSSLVHPDYIVGR
jgi:hypothetical protein